MSRFVVHVAGVLLFVSVLLSVPTAHGVDYTAAPMCGEVRGFAGEHNDRIRVGVPISPAEGEAIVLIVRAFPLNIGELSQRWIQLNATYRLREGVTASLQSNSDGIVLIHDVEAGTDIDIHVRRVREDGPVPFRFWSYHANRPSCHIDVSAANSFVAPIPTRLGSVAGPAKVYFKSVAPPGAKGFMLELANSLYTTPITGFQVMSSAAVETGATHVSKEVVSWGNGVVYFMIAPPVTTDSSHLLRVSIVWVDDINAAAAAGGAGDHSTSPQRAPGEEAGRTETSKPGVSSDKRAANTSSGESKTDAKRKWSFLDIIFVLFFIFILYMVVMSAINYYVKGITQFPEMIPFIDFFRLCGQYVSITKERFSRGGYRDINREGMSTVDI